MKPIKFPLRSTLALFAIAGLLALFMPSPYTGAAPNVISKIFR